MEYKVTELAQLAGISSRTLRYYDEIGLLKLARINSSGYRIYDKITVDTLQQILFYRERGINLHDIKNIITSPSFDRVKALREHHARLLDKIEQLEVLVTNVEKTIAMTEGGVFMSDKEKFKGFKHNMIDENELKYGNETRNKFGDDAVNRSNQKLKNMTKEQYVALERLSNEVNEAIKLAFETGDPSSELSQKACELHKKWLLMFWDKYSKEAHMSLVQGYVDDKRFTAHYDKIAPECAVFLRDAIRVYTGIES